MGSIWPGGLYVYIRLNVSRFLQDLMMFPFWVDLSVEELETMVFVVFGFVIWLLQMVSPRGG